MANRFFTNLIDLVTGTRARAGDVEANLSAVEAGFDILQAELDAIPDLPAPQANKFIGWNSLGTALQNYTGAASVAVSAFMEGVVSSVSAAAARTSIGATAIGDALFTSSDAASARASLDVTPSNIGAAASGANADITSLAGLTSINGAGFNKNAIINGGFTVNQRGYVSAAVLAAGVYGHDRWKAGASGGDYSFTQLASNTTITIAASKTLIQVIEDKNVHSTRYVISWTGTALGRVGVNSGTPSGAYATSPIVVTTQTAGTIMSVEFGNGASTGTLGNVQVEATTGSIASAFERRPFSQELALCQRYFEVLPPVSVMFPWASATALIRGHHSFAVTKRATPVITMGGKTEGVGTLSPTATNTFGVVYGGTGSIQDVVTYTTNTAASEL